MKLKPFLLLSFALLLHLPTVPSTKRLRGRDKTVQKHSPAKPIERHESQANTYHIKGKLRKQTVVRPAVLIDGNTLASLTIHGIEHPTVCDRKKCLSPKEIQKQAVFTYWTVKSKLRKGKPTFFKGDIAKSQCFLNDKSRKNKFKQIVRGKNEYACSAKCKQHDVVVCDGKIAGLLAKSKKANRFVFHNITRIVKARETKTKKRNKRKDEFDDIYTVKSNGRPYFFAVAVSNVALVSYKFPDNRKLLKNEIKICNNTGCTVPLRIVNEPPYTFWKINKRVGKMNFFKGDLTKAKCVAHRKEGNTPLKQGNVKKREYLCRSHCKVSDVVVCDGKIAGFLAETKKKGSFLLHEIKAILQFLKRKRTAINKRKPSKSRPRKSKRTPDDEPPPAETTPEATAAPAEGATEAAAGATAPASEGAEAAEGTGAAATAVSGVSVAEGAGGEGSLGTQGGEATGVTQGGEVTAGTVGGTGEGSGGGAAGEGSGVGVGGSGEGSGEEGGSGEGGGAAGETEGSGSGSGEGSGETTGSGEAVPEGSGATSSGEGSGEEPTTELEATEVTETVAETEGETEEVTTIPPQTETQPLEETEPEEEPTTEVAASEEVEYTQPGEEETTAAAATVTETEAKVEETEATTQEETTTEEEPQQEETTTEAVTEPETTEETEPETAPEVEPSTEAESSGESSPAPDYSEAHDTTLPDERGDDDDDDNDLTTSKDIELPAKRTTHDVIYRIDWAKTTSTTPKKADEDVGVRTSKAMPSSLSNILVTVSVVLVAKFLQ